MSIPSTPLRADAQRNYDKLLQAAATLFNANRSPTLEHIAKRAGVGIGTLYRHFPTKKLLLEAVYAQKLTSITDKASKLMQAPTPDQALAEWLRTIVTYSATYGGFSDFIALSIKDKNSPLITTGAELLNKAQAAGSVRNDLTITELLHLIHAITDDGTGAQVNQARKLLSIVVSGLRLK